MKKVIGYVIVIIFSIVAIGAIITAPPPLVKLDWKDMLEVFGLTGLCVVIALILAWGIYWVFLDKNE